jgi:nicotinate-nucleotide adenylyltransferase
VNDVERIGILGGTFDPPHNGHLLLAATAREQLGLDRVLFMPVGDPTHKNRLDLTNVSDRVAMTVMATFAQERFQLDLTDALRQEPHYTVTLLPLLLAQNKTAQFWLLMGGDSLRDFHTWHLPDALLTMCRLAVLPRPGAVLEWERLATRFPTVRERVDLLAGETIDLSSTWLRENPTEISPHVPPLVFDYISQHRLYKKKTRTDA